MTVSDTRQPVALFVGEEMQRFYEFTEPLIVRYLRPGDVLLDVGCGDGFLGIKLRRQADLKLLVGIDLRPMVIRRAESMANPSVERFAVGNAEDCEWVATMSPFDVVLMRNVLHHFKDPLVALKKYGQMLNPGGRLILVDIDREAACGDMFGLPLTLLITWCHVWHTIGWRAARKAIRGMKYPSREWREHRAEDMKHRKAIGWFRYRDIRKKLHSAFPKAEIGRLASFCGLGGVHYMVYEKAANA
jgi:SAM-dependent methyltransferase